MTVRRAGAGDQSLVRSTRLRALADAPLAFESTLERESAWTDAQWRRRLDEGATFLVEAEPEPAGMVWGAPHRDNPADAFLMSMWIDPAHRGTGAADALVKTLLAWATGEGLGTVWLHVGEDNPRARRVYARNGFRETGRRIAREPDGLPEIEMCRVLRGDGAGT